MTYADALTLRTSLEAALAGGTLSVTLNGRSITYRTTDELRATLNGVIRDINRYERDAAGQTNPGIKTPKWNH